MEKYAEAINNLYSTKEDLIIIGLTGRTGAGCSTAARILHSKLETMDFEYENRPEYTIWDEHKFDIVKEYISKNRWQEFEIIEGSSVILSYVFERKITNLGDYLTALQAKTDNRVFEIKDKDELIKEIEGLKHIFAEVKQHSLLELEDILSGKKTDPKKEIKDVIEEYYKIYIEDMPKYKEFFKQIVGKYTCREIEKSKLQDKENVSYHLYTYLLQRFGNNIRSSGNPYDEKFEPGRLLDFAKRLGILIELIIRRNREKKRRTRICIDAIRNANESNYLKDKYRSYYLISISVDEANRRKRLKNLNAFEIKSIDDIEYSDSYKSDAFFCQQNIAQCFEMADIHIYNEQTDSPKKFFLTWQLIKYVTLMIHPGIITPSNLERCMQLAYNAKYNSGCLSRQVGAVITGNDYSIKAVGWNDVPKGQLPCNLRDVSLYCKGNHEECFSSYEVEDERFQKALEDINYSVIRSENDLGGRKFAFCFKDVYNGYTGEKNQVFTRALHAEENAFLQISKYGGMGIKDGYLFVTASPCELCSKKAYQLGIRGIYYIDHYPGIAATHILKFGKRQEEPQMKLFYGAIGEAYIALYKPLLAYKDELELVSGISCKQIAKDGKQKKIREPQTNDLYYKKIEISLEFKTKESMECIRNIEFGVKAGEICGFEKKLTWTGSSYECTESCEEKNESYEVIDCKDRQSPYRYIIQFNEGIKAGNESSYSVRSILKDEGHCMRKYSAHYIKHPTDKLILKLIEPKENKIFEEVYYKRYADADMSIEYLEDVKVDTKDDDNGRTIHTLEINRPNLFYTYSLEWEFVKEDTNENE